MNKKLTIIFSAIIVVAVAAAAVAFFMPAAPVDLNLTMLTADPQTAPERPPAFPDPALLIIQMPDSPNIALGKPVTASSFTDIYVATNAVDGQPTSYWESEGLPAEFTIDLQGTYNIQTVGVTLNPSPLWEARTQAFEILISADGSNFTSLVPSARYEFNPNYGNAVRVDFAPTSAQFVRLIFTENTASRTQGAQAAQIMVFE